MRLVSATVLFAFLAACSCSSPEPEDSNNSIIRISQSKRYFEHPDGSLFYPIGTALNGAFITYDATPAQLERYFGDMKKSGENFIRIDVEGFSWSDTYDDVRAKIDAGVIEFLENPVGHYNEDYAERIDSIIDLAEKYDVYLELVLTSHSCTLHDKYDLYPYHVDKGGPVRSIAEFRENEEARELFKSRIRYIVDRFGGRDRIFAWELENEINWPGCGGGDPAVTRSWVEEMASTLRTHELETRGFSRPVGFSLGSMLVPSTHTSMDYFFTYTSPATDVIHHHNYESERISLNPVTSAKYLREAVVRNLENADFQKPFLENERKNLLRKNHLSREKVLENERYATWAYLASGAAGSGATWTEYLTDTPTPVASSAGTILDFLDGFDSKRIIDTRPVEIRSSNQDVLAMAIGNRGFLLGWLMHDNVMDFEIELLMEWEEMFRDSTPDMETRLVRISKSVNVLAHAGENIDLDAYLAELRQRIADYAQEHSIELPDDLDSTESLQNLVRLVMQHLDSMPPEHREALGREVDSVLTAIEDEIRSRGSLIAALYSNHPEVDTTLELDLDPGDYTVRWYASTSGQWIEDESVQGPQVELRAPAFAKHLAFVVF